MQKLKLSKERRRELIVATAVKVANKNGLHSVNYQTVAKAAEPPMSSRTVWDFFRTKDELWRAAVTDHRALPDVRKAAQDFGLLPSTGA